MGFPEYAALHPNIPQAWKQIGNAICPPVALRWVVALADCMLWPTPNRFQLLTHQLLDAMPPSARLSILHRMNPPNLTPITSRFPHPPYPAPLVHPVEPDLGPLSQAILDILEVALVRTDSSEAELRQQSLQLAAANTQLASLPHLLPTTDYGTNNRILHQLNSEQSTSMDNELIAACELIEAQLSRVAAEVTATTLGRCTNQTTDSIHDSTFHTPINRRIRRVRLPTGSVVIRTAPYRNPLPQLRSEAPGSSAMLPSSLLRSLHSDHPLQTAVSHTLPHIAYRSNPSLFRDWVRSYDKLLRNLYHRCYEIEGISLSLFLASPGRALGKFHVISSPPHLADPLRPRTPS